MDLRPKVMPHCLLLLPHSDRFESGFEYSLSLKFRDATAATSFLNIFCLPCRMGFLRDLMSCHADKAVNIVSCMNSKLPVDLREIEQIEQELEDMRYDIEIFKEDEIRGLDLYDLDQVCSTKETHEVFEQLMQETDYSGKYVIVAERDGLLALVCYFEKASDDAFIHVVCRSVVDRGSGYAGATLLRYVVMFLKNLSASRVSLVAASQRIDALVKYYQNKIGFKINKRVVGQNAIFTRAREIIHTHTHNGLF